MFDSIVVPVELGISQERTLDVARALARRSGLPVELVSVVDPSRSGEVIDLTEPPAALEGLQASRVVLEGDEPTVAIIQHLDSHPGALPVIGGHRIGSAGKRVLGALSDELLHLLDQPVLVVGPQVVEVPRMTTIVLDVDREHDPDAYVAAVHDWMDVFGAVDSLVVEVVDPDGRAAADASAEADQSAAQDEVDDAFVAELARRLDAEGVLAEWEVVHGKGPVHALERLAARFELPLVVVAGERWSDTSDQPRDSSRDLALHLPCPVLVVPADRIDGRTIDLDAAKAVTPEVAAAAIQSGAPR